MAIVAEIIGTKGGELVCAGAGATVLEATRLMNEHHVGSVLVVNPEGAIVGIMTERDLLTRVLGQERNPCTTLVQEVMTADVIFCTHATTLDELRELFRSRRIRHVPVKTHEGGVCAMVSIGDVNAWDAQQLAATVSSLTDYITRA
jgi:CBS domain-containing protein